MCTHSHCDSILGVVAIAWLLILSLTKYEMLSMEDLILFNVESFIYIHYSP